ncbi:hypothetical protein GIB67_008851 [Kingdonia uniflora]|uniref:Uncharacterized protein n=1 Tax=Kingdonia uniflora TaxID=39325 RepID=A0A7J7LVC0_9MAGN|nr:hypothetical protein GIB67_008851 [Kingdonia uniflora]
MKSDKEVNEQVDEENQTQEGGAKKGILNAKNYTSRYTGLGLHKMFVALPEEEKSVLRATYFAPLLLINPIATMSTLVVEIFDRHLGDIKFQFGKTIIQMKAIHVCLILGLLVSPIENEFLFVDPEHMTNFRMRQFPKKKNIWRNQIKTPTIGAAPAISVPAVDAPAVGAPTIVGDSTLPLGDTPLLGQYQFSLLEKTAKRKREEGTKKETFIDEQFDHVPLIQLKILIPKIPKKGLANRVPRKKRAEFSELENIQSTAKNLLQQVTPGEGLEVVIDLMVDDDAEVNLEAISSEYGGDLLKRKKGDEKDNNDKKDVKENAKSEEEQPQVVEEEDSEPPTTMVVVEVAKIDIVFFNQVEIVGEAYQSIYLHASADQKIVVSVEEQTLEVEKTEDEASQASADQTTAVYVNEQTIEVAQTDVVISHQEEDAGKASQSKLSKEEVEQNKEEVVEGKDDDDGNLQNKPNPEQVIKEMVVDQTNLGLMESEVDITLKKRHALTEDEINERTFIMAYRMNQMHAHLDELHPGVLLESFTQRTISQDEKNQVDQVRSLGKDKLSPEAKKNNRSTYMMIGH